MPTPISQKYEVLGKLGQGGMGIVYKVRHKALETTLALKTLPADLTDNPDLIARFTREARVMSRLRHGNIVQSIDFDFDGSLYYLVMEYIEGKTLKQYVNEKGALPLADVLEIARQAASALAFAHNNNPPIIHRDIKPANIMIEDPSKRVVVMDFGIAKELGGGVEETKAGVMIGTVKYSAPEQLRHEPLAGSADIYSLGLVIYELYTGKQFFAGLSEYDVIGKVLHESQEHEVRFTRPTPEKFTAVLTKAIAKNCQQRYQRMEELLRDLETCQATLGSNDDTIALTAVLPLAGDGAPPKTQEPVEVEDLEKQIQQLQQERERRLAATVQRQAQEAREKAARAGAAEHASPLFQQALSREASASKSFRDKNYLLAQTVYQEAIKLFEQAGDEAVLATAKQVGEQKREEIATLKAEAERYDARERARTFYGRALALQAQADDLWEQKDYIQAGQAYAQARGVFADACELARRDLLREEAATARQGTIAAKEAAADAVQLAAALFQEAESAEQQANRAMELEEFTQARPLYQNAQQQYERAHTQAQQRATARERAHAAQRHTDTIKERIAELTPWAGPRWQEAQQLEAQAQQAFATQAYDPATEQYTQAGQRYVSAGEEAEAARQHQQIGELKKAAEQAQTAAEQVEAPRYAAQSYSQAVQVQQRGAHCFSNKQWDEAREDFTRARTLFTEAGQRAQSEKECVATAAVYAQVDRARIQAEQAGVRKRFEDGFVEVQRFVAQGRASEQQERYTQARRLYEQAIAQFDALRRQARLQADREDTEGVRRQMEDLREQVRPFQSRAAELWTQAQHHEATAEQAYRDSNYQEAAAEYDRAAQTYEQVGGEGRRAQLREEAAHAAQREHDIQATAAVRQRMSDAQTEAERAGAAERFRELFAQAQHVAEQGREHEQREEFTQAATRYDQGAQEFTRLGDEALKAAARERAQAAHRRTEAITQGIAGLTPWAGPQWRQAQEFEAAAQRALASESYDQAADFYTRARQSYEAAGTEAEEARQRQSLAELKTQAERAQREARQAEARQYAATLYEQAGAAIQQGERSVADKQWDQARAAFLQAQKLFAEAQHQAQQEKARAAALTAYEQVEQERAQAEQAGARKRFQEAFAQAHRLVEQGQASARDAHYEQACSLYEQAAHQFVQLRHEAVLQAAREGAEEARRGMETLKRESEPLARRAKAMWQEAQRVESEATHAWQLQDYALAAERYTQAIQHYAHARRAAEEAQQREHATQCQRQAAQAQVEADQDDVQRSVPTLYRQAAAEKERAERALAAEQWEEAAQHFLQAQELFIAAQQSAQTEKERQAAVAARAAALEGQQQASAGKQSFPDRFEEAESAFLHASAAFGREQWQAAHAGFTSSAELFQAIHHDTVLRWQQEQAEHARDRARALQSKAATATGRRKRRAEKTFATAEQSFQHGHYSEAQATYEQAAELFAALPMQEPKGLSGTALRYGTALVLVAAIGLVVARWLSPPLTLTPEERSTTEPATTEPATVETPQAKLPTETAVEKPSPPEPTMAKTTQVAPTPPPLTITRAAPNPAETISIAEGNRVTFAVEANSPEHEPLQYAWSLDGQQQAESREWVYQPDFTAGGGKPKEVQVVVRDQADRRLERVWRIEVADVNRRPQVVAMSPRDRVVQMTPEQKQEFAVEATDPDPDDQLVYTWFVDGEKTECKKSKCQFEAFSSDKNQHAVQVAISDTKKDGTIQVAWNIAVKAIPPPPLPLLITRATPKPEGPITVAEGKSLTFAVETQSRPDTPLRYTWFLDGKTQRGDKTWTYRPDFTAAGAKPKEVKVVVSDPNEEKAEQTWRIGVQDVNQPPRITSASPRPDTAVELTPQERREFAVQAIDPDPDDRLVYNWFVNDNAVPCKTSTCRFSPPSSDQARYTVRVDISDTKDNGKVQVAWNITVKAPAPPRIIAAQPEPKEVVVVKAVPPPPTVQLTEVEVQDWLENYRRAWEGMCEQDNTTTLLRLRVTLDQSLDPTRRTICSYSSYRVALQNPTPRVEGKQATVTFDRVDTIDGRVMKPVRLTFTIEKEANGRIVRQR